LPGCGAQNSLPFTPAGCFVKHEGKNKKEAITPGDEREI